MRYYKLHEAGEDLAFIESKTGMTDAQARREAVSQRLMDTVDAESAEVDEIDEDEYELNA